MYKMKYIIKDNDQLYELDKIDFKKISFKNIDVKNRINIFYEENKIFYLDPLTMFKTYGLQYKFNRYKIGIILDEKLDEHKKLIKFINYINDILNNYIEFKDNIIVSNVKNPLNKSKNNTYILNLVLHSSCKITDYDTRENLDIENIKNKKIYLYPIISCPMFFIYDNVCYTSYSIHEAYIKLESINETSSSNIAPVIDYNRVTNALNKLNLDE
jgi:hypothetical protein